jgi:Mg2+-importing ATPase
MLFRRQAQHKARADDLSAVSRLAPETACQKLGSNAVGLVPDEAARRLKSYGPNLITREHKPTILQEIWQRAKNPLNALLLTLATVSYFLGDLRAALVIVIMVFLSVITAFVQEHRSNEAAARLRAMVKTTATVRRLKSDGDAVFAEMPIETLVPGDIVRLSAGDMIPADLRLLEAKDLFVNQSALTGEAMPTEKYAQACGDHIEDPFDLPNVCFMGANVVSGYATGLIVRTGAQTFLANWPTKLRGGTFRLRSTAVSTGSPCS